MRSRRSDDATAEPSLRELLDDPVAQLMMKRDGVSAKAVIDLIQRLQAARRTT